MTTPGPETRDIVFDRILNELEAFEQQVATLPVAPAVTPGEIRRHLARYDFGSGVPLQDLVADVVTMMRHWSLHVNHPRYFGLFNPSVRRAGIAADTLVALYNPQLAAWAHAPAANEVERHTLAFLMRHFGMDPDTGFANFTSGGQEANLTATIAALTHVFPEFGTRGLRGLPGQPTLYLSNQGHHSFVKVAHMTGLGRDAVRDVTVDRRLRLDVEQLKVRLEADRERGCVPFLIVATAGTTALGVIDPLQDVADVARDAGAWFHVDAAWGGAAALSPALRPHLAGIEQADSITCDAHKWLSVPVGAGMFFSRKRTPILDAFRVAASYVPAAVAGTFEPYHTTAQWSRRFIGLKLFLTLAELGRTGVAEMLERQVAMAARLREGLGARGWRLVGDSPLAIVGFTHRRIERGDTTCGAVLKQVNDRGQAWISEVTLPDGASALRACVCSHRTTEVDVDLLIEELERAISNRASEDS